MMGELEEIKRVAKPARDPARGRRHDPARRPSCRPRFHERVGPDRPDPDQGGRRRAWRRGPSRCAKSLAVPIKYLGVGEKVDALEGRSTRTGGDAASWAWGDMLSLIGRAGGEPGSR